MPMPDLSAIDQYVKTQGPGSLMDRVVATLDDDQRETLDAACGLTYDGTYKRPWTAIAAWLQDISREDGKVTADKVSSWAASQ